MPKVAWQVLDKAAQAQGERWGWDTEKSQVLLSILREERRRRDEGATSGACYPADVVAVADRWMAIFGLRNAQEAAQLLWEMSYVRNKAHQPQR